LEIWKELQKKNINVLFLPSHSSNFTQPLDLSVNACFKTNLSKIKNYPNKTKCKVELNQFIRDIRGCIYLALNPECIKKGFHRALITAEDGKSEELQDQIQKLIQSFPPTCPSHLIVLLFIQFK
jgi:hypothetical protein